MWNYEEYYFSSSSVTWWQCKNWQGSDRLFTRSGTVHKRWTLGISSINHSQPKTTKWYECSTDVSYTHTDVSEWCHLYTYCSYCCLFNELITRLGRVHTYTSTSTSSSVRVPKNMKSSTYLWQAFTQTRVPVRVRVTRKLTDTGRVCTGWVFSQPVLVYLAFM